MSELNQLIAAAQRSVAKHDAEYRRLVEREKEMIAEAKGEMCPACGNKHTTGLGSDYWEPRWIAYGRLEAAHRVLDLLLAEQAAMPAGQLELPLKPGFVFRERTEVRKGECGGKSTFVIGELIPNE